LKIIPNLLGIRVTMVRGGVLRVDRVPGVGAVTRVGSVTGVGAVPIVYNRRTATVSLPQIKGFVRRTRELLK